VSGPECDWCSASGEDLSINSVGGEFVCDPCCHIASAGRELLAALQQLLYQAQQMEGMFPDDDGTIDAAIGEAIKAINLAKGRGE
jgi:hypothetical protein